jgi:AraC-like DNA-binding protein
VEQPSNYIMKSKGFFQLILHRLFELLFTKETGLTVNQYIMKTRIRNAEIMLQSGTHTVTEVADYCGYSDVIHFYRQFKTIMNISPS